MSRHADDWDRLALAAPESQPMVSHAWVAAFFENCVHPGATWLCLFAYEERELVGVLPVVLKTRILGAQLSAPYDAHTRSGYALLTVGKEDRALTALMTTLTRIEPRHVSIRFHGIRAGSPALAARTTSNSRARTLDSLVGRGSVLPTTGSLTDYQKSLNDNFRRNLRKAHNRCARNHELAFRVYSGSDAAATHLLQQFLEVEAAGWKGAAGTAIKCDPKLVDFYTALADRLSQRGWLEWHFLTLDDKPVAGHFAVRFGRSLVLEKIGYDEEYARLGPGNMLFHEVVARAFADDDTDEINCVTDMAWHVNWHVETEEYSDMLFTPRRLVPSTLGLLEIELPSAVIRRAKDTPWLLDMARKGKAAHKHRIRRRKVRKSSHGTTD